MKNNERFFGLHFDFHANHDTDIGVRTNPEDIQWYIDEAKPDYIQCDCKGHAGISSYPTKVGNAAKGLKADNLRVWVDTVKKNGLPVYVHYSGVLDNEYVKNHPNDAARNADGEIDMTAGTAAASLFGNYCDNLLIPQIKELIEEYDIDGIWIDGDCWAVHCDYSDNAKPYLKDGMTEEEHKKLMHDAFFEYMKKYTDELHKVKPDFKICSNWAYAYMPDKIEVDVDFLSGDYCCFESVYAGRLEGRQISYRDRPWDLMDWAFVITPNIAYAEKPGVQLCQEAAIVLTLGGGFELYIAQNKDGSIKKSESTRLREVSDFVKKRQINYQKKTKSQVGIYYSEETRYKFGNIFNAQGSTKGMLGAIEGVLDTQYTTEILPEFMIDEIDKYEAFVIPEWTYISKKNEEKLVNYAKNGGHLIVIGAELSSKMAYLVNDSFDVKKAEDISRIVFIKDKNGHFTQISGNVANVNVGEGRIYSNNDLRDETEFPAYRIEKMGNGTITYIPFDFGSFFYLHRSYVLRNFFADVMGEIIEKPWVEVNCPLVDITVQETENGELVNLINLQQGRHHDFNFVYDYIPPVYNLEVVINKSYKDVKMPLGEEFEYEICENCIKLKLKKLDIHSIIELSN